MNIKECCNYCKGRRTITREVVTGDIITPNDGSGLPNGLKPILQIWQDGVVIGFEPIKVLHIEGEALFVTPMDWKGKQFASEIYAARSWMNINGDGREGFWVYAPHCHPIKEVK